MDALVLKQQWTKSFHRWTLHSTGIPKQTGAGGAGEQCMHACHIAFHCRGYCKKKKKCFSERRAWDLMPPLVQCIFWVKKLKWCFFFYLSLGSMSISPGVHLLWRLTTNHFSLTPFGTSKALFWTSLLLCFFCATCGCLLHPLSSSINLCLGDALLWWRRTTRKCRLVFGNQ